jgi:maleylpyruvate isomerase
VLAEVADHTDADMRRPSLLPGWSIGHVLTHLARNADSHVHMLAGAAQGEMWMQYGPDQRERQIEEGAGRDAATILDDLRASIAALDAAWDSVTDEVWATGAGRVRQGPCPVRELPFRRWREVEIHHADLGGSFTYADFTPEYVDREMQEPADNRFSGRTF